jgi:hypothetical protein
MTIPNNVRLAGFSFNAFPRFEACSPIHFLPAAVLTKEHNEHNEQSTMADNDNDNDNHAPTRMFEDAFGDIQADPNIRDAQSRGSRRGGEAPPA